MAKKATTAKDKPNQGFITSLSRFHTVKRIEKATDQWTRSLQDAHAKWVKAPVDDAKTLFGDLKKAPRPTIDRMVADSRKQVSEFNQSSRRKIETWTQDGKELITKTKKAPANTLGGLIDDGKRRIAKLREETRDTANDIIKDLEKDARLAVDDLTAFSARQFDRIPGKKNMQKNIRERMASVPAQFNLPSKEDMENLMNGLKQLTAKVETLNQEQAACATGQ